jgi:heat shock protein HslJ
MRNFSRISSIGLILFAVIILSGCTSQQPVLPIPQTEQASLTGGLPANVAFHLISYRSGEEDQVVPIGNAPITVTFGADGNLTGSSGCNSYSAPFRVDEPALTIGTPVESSRMRCDSLVMIQEQRFLALLPQAVSYGMVAPDTLAIYDNTGDVIMVFEKTVS